MSQIKVLEKSNLENILISVSISGILVSRIKILDDRSRSEFKFVSSGGREYTVITTDTLKDSLSQYSGKYVKIIGMLNKSNMALIAQKVIPLNSDDEKNNIVDLEINKRKKLVKKIANKVNELVIIPIGILAILAA